MKIHILVSFIFFDSCFLNLASDLSLLVFALGFWHLNIGIGFHPELIVTPTYRSKAPIYEP